MMTQAQKEAAARYLCQLRGIDPYEPLGHSKPGSMLWSMSPAWMVVIAEIEARDQLDDAMAFGREQVSGERGKG